MSKSVRLFKNFMDNEVHLNKTRLDRLDGHVEAVGTFLCESNLGIQSVTPQGSYAHGTIIKPAKKNKEFDADILVWMEPHKRCEPKNYIEALHKLFKSNPIYAPKVRKKSRCITLNYARDFHLDVVPFLRIDKWYHIYERYGITNRNENYFERTDGFGYTDWLMSKNALIPNDYFLDSIKLLKYLRDIKQNFSVKSILLNTLLGELVYSNEDWETCFCNFPTAFKTLLNRLNDWLQEHEEEPLITNPCLETEDFNRHWDEKKYHHFRKMIALYTEKFNDAFAERNRIQSLKKWQGILGPKFGK